MVDWLFALSIEECDKDDEENDTADVEGEFGGKGTFAGSTLTTSLFGLFTLCVLSSPGE